MSTRATTDLPSRIVELEDRVRNQIAAGEVVERPASVVKELCENALDAGAGELVVELEDGGVRLVRVADDGCGMGPADLALAFTPHATSKLRTLEDLDHIGSLGFRGEALASIGSVSRASILSRPEGSPIGWVVSDEGGRVSSVVEAGSKRGTSVEVRDLFYNTPARRRFLKRPATELGRVLDVLQRLILAHPGVGFVVTHDGRRVLDVERGMDLRARVRRVFGAELAEALAPVAGRDGDLALSGLVAPPRLSRGDTTRQMWFLNGRPLRDKLLVRALKQAYHGVLVEGRQPVAFLALELDPAAVDVNVHPTKSEVRFRDERRIFGFLQHHLVPAVRATDMATPGARLVDAALARDWVGEGRPAWQPTLPDPGGLTARPGGLTARPGALAAPDAGRADPGSVEILPAPRALESWTRRDPLSGPFLQIGKTFVVRPFEDGFEVIDQHALHERITLEALTSELAGGALEVQRRLVPELVDVSPAEAELLVENGPQLERAGLLLERFGPGTLAVQGLPARLGSTDASELVRDVLASFEQHGRAPTIAEILEEVLHSAACRHSVMAGDELSQEEMRALFQRAEEVGGAPTCAHARPTRVRFTRADLERAFLRR